MEVKICFANGYVGISEPGECARLYKDDKLIASMPMGVAMDNASAINGLFYGYFAGFRDCKKQIKEAFEEGLKGV